jgi:hypothetical protein
MNIISNLELFSFVSSRVNVRVSGVSSMSSTLFMPLQNFFEEPVTSTTWAIDTNKPLAIA